MDFNEKLGNIEQELYSKYPHLRPQQQPQQQQPQQKYQVQQEQQENFNRQVELEKQRVCDMLIDYHNKKHERLATTYMIDSLYDILSRPLAAEDRIYYKRQLSAIENAIRPQQQQAEQTPPNFKSAEELVNSQSVENVEKA